MTPGQDDRRMRFVSLVGILGAVVLLSGCRLFNGDDTAKSRGRPHTPQELERVTVILNARRSDSLKEWNDRKIGDDDALNYAAVRTAILFPSSPDSKVTIQERRTAHQVDYSISVHSKELEMGSAVPLTADGYFLTAGHCVDKPKLTLIALVKSRALQKTAARVVWRGQEQNGEPDLALIHASLAPYEVLKPAGFVNLEKHIRIYTSGYGTGKFPKNQGQQGSAGGLLLSQGTIQGSPGGVRWRQLHHNAPATPGDSGGPLIDECGQLLGITTMVDYRVVHVLGRDWLWSYKCAAVAPDPAWLQSLVERDRAQRRKASRGA